jgi:hypothetical protein
MKPVFMVIYYPKLIKHIMKTCSNHKIISQTAHTLMSSKQETSVTQQILYFSLWVGGGCVRN